MVTEHRTSVAAALLADEQGFQQPVLLRFRWDEPHRREDGQWGQTLWLWDELTGDETDVGQLTLRWRWVLAWPPLLKLYRKQVENEVIVMLEAAALEIEEEDR